jgi:hypothetical protein
MLAKSFIAVVLGLAATAIASGTAEGVTQDSQAPPPGYGPGPRYGPGPPGPYRGGPGPGYGPRPVIVAGPPPPTIIVAPPPVGYGYGPGPAPYSYGNGDLGGWCRDLDVPSSRLPT